MKQATKHIISSIAFVLILILLLFASSYVLSPKSNTSKDGMIDAKAYGVLAEKENSIDVLFIGDSESYSTFIPLQLWNEYGFTSYVCATSNQKLFYTKDLLVKALENQKPKVVILETNAIYTKYGYLESTISKTKQIFSVFNYHNRWKSLNFSDFITPPDYDHVDNNKGFLCNLGCIPPTNAEHYMDDTGKVEEISRRNKNILRDIKDICDENGAQLLLVSVSSTKNWNSAKHKGVVNFIDELGVKYVDMNVLKDEIAIDWKKDTHDKGDHLNYYGAVKATKYMGGYLNSMNILQSHKDDLEYNDWNVLWQKYITTVPQV